MAYKDITGLKFGRLLVLEKVGFTEKPRWVIWRCKCDCGNICDVTSNLLLDNKKRSCGCLRIESNRKRIGAAHAKMPYIVFSALSLTLAADMKSIF